MNRDDLIRGDGKRLPSLVRRRPVSGEVDEVLMFEVIELPNWNPELTFSPAVRAGDFVFTAGFTATDGSGRIIHEGDIVAQARHIYQKIGSVLQHAGGSLENVIETTEFFIPDPNYRKTAELRRELFGSRFPASTGIPVSSLIRKGALIEIKATAYVPRGSDGP